MIKRVSVSILLLIVLCTVVSLSASADNSFADSESTIASSETAELSDVSTNGSGSDKVFQILSVGIMTIGILGLPVYFVLLSRKKRLLREYEENTSKEKDSEDGEEIE